MSIDVRKKRKATGRELPYTYRTPGTEYLFNPPTEGAPEGVGSVITVDGPRLASRIPSTLSKDRPKIRPKGQRRKAPVRPSKMKNPVPPPFPPLPPSGDIPYNQYVLRNVKPKKRGKNTAVGKSKFSKVKENVLAVNHKDIYPSFSYYTNPQQVSPDVINADPNYVYDPYVQDMYYERRVKRQTNKANRRKLSRPTGGLERGPVYFGNTSNAWPRFVDENYDKALAELQAKDMAEGKTGVISAARVNRLLSKAYRSSLGYSEKRKKNEWVDHVKEFYNRPSVKKALSEGTPSSVLMQEASQEYRFSNALPSRNYGYPAGGYSAGGYKAGGYTGGGKGSNKSVRSPWHSFVKQNFKKVSNQYPNYDNGQIMSILGQMYRS